MDVKKRKKIILIMLDTLMDKPFQKALKEESLPAFSYFLEHAQYFPEVVTPFPAISVNVESTLITGQYSDRHGVPALVWFNHEENRIINYGTNVIELLKLGLSKGIYDALYRLNNEHLNPSVATIYEDLHQAGKTSASINALVYRGAVPHQLKVPGLIRFFLNMKESINTHAPDEFVYGKLARLSSGRKYSCIWNKYGFNNNFSVQEFTCLIKAGKIPDFSIVYFPDHDKNVHKRGPMDVKGIKEMDLQLKKVLNAFPSREQALSENIWLLMGDNGQAVVGDSRENSLVDLRKLLSPFKISKLRKGVQAEDQIVLGMNLRSCFIYSLKPEAVPLQKIAEVLQEDSRIEMIAWKEEQYIHVISGEKEGKLKFSKNGNMSDEYNQHWSLEGDPHILDLTVEGKEIQYGNYPDGLMRLYSALHSHKGNYIIASVKPGYEFIGESTPKHNNGASHGGFHKDDSLIPMIVGGTSTKPEFMRIVDLKRWILNLIERDGDYNEATAGKIKSNS